MIICGQEFEFSALNANDLDRMDAAQQHIQVPPTSCAASAAL